MIAYIQPESILLKSGTAPSRNQTSIATVGMLIRGYGLSNLSGARSRKHSGGVEL